MTDTTIDIGALQKLKSMIGGDAEDLAELVEDFLSSLPEQLATMHTAQDAQDWPGLRIAAHSCKSNARDLGATQLGALCATLEHQCKTGELVDLSAQITAIQAAANDAISALTALDLADV